MDKQIIIQLIQTLGLILSPLLAIVLSAFYWQRVHKIRTQLGREAKLLKEAAFYRFVIDKYIAQSKDEDEKGLGNKNSFWAEAKLDLGMSAPYLTEPNRLIERLRDLKELDEKLEEALKKLKT